MRDDVQAGAGATPSIECTADLRLRCPVYFTTGLFAPDNPLLREVAAGGRGGPARLLFVVDRGACRGHSDLLAAIERYCRAHGPALDLACPPLLVPGGEAVKNTREHVAVLHEVIRDAALCRRSYLVAVGGGAVIDMAGYAAATAHRGLRAIRVPTTALAQADAAVGIENGLNACGRKNFVATLAPPFAVLTDFDFLATLSDRDWRSGLAEAVKAALVLDAAFFDVLEAQAGRLVAREMAPMRQAVARSAELHLRRLAGSGDPFDGAAARALDFGHWAAHRLETLTGFALRHGEAVAVGMALDAAYSHLAGLLSEADCGRILALLSALGFDLWVPELAAYLDRPEHPRSIVRGLEEFRERVGGPLSVTLLDHIGASLQVPALSCRLLQQSVGLLEVWNARHAPRAPVAA